MNNLQIGEIRQGVLVGHDGYLFLYSGGQKQFAFLTGELIPTEESRSNFNANISARNRYCREHGLQYLHVVFPSKPVVATRKIPEPLRTKVHSLYQQRYEKCLSQEARTVILYPLEILQEMDQQQPAFQPLDTHLTDAGNLAVVTEIFRRMDLKIPDASMYRREENLVSGDLAKMLASAIRCRTERIRPTFPYDVFDNRSALPSNTNNITIIHSPKSSYSKRLIIFGDSFIKEALPLLAAQFRDILYVRSPQFQPDLIELFDPEMVISSNAERYLSHVDSDTNSTPIIWELYGDPGYQPTPSFRHALAAQLSRKHHPSAFRRWQRSDLSIEIGNLGRYSSNSQIETMDREVLSFRSIGNDPYFNFPKTCIAPGMKFELRITLLSKVESVATVYYCTTLEQSFSETRTIRRPVAQGRNELHFPLTHPELSPAIRLDPLTCPGEFRIEAISLAPMK